MFDSIINPFVQKVFLTVSDANPELKKYTIVVSDWPIMNAAYVGGNVIVFHIPLLSRLKSEAEVAAVLCHELAHGELDHLQNGIITELNRFYDKKFQKELRKTLREDFNVNKKLDVLALRFNFSNRFHSRSSEKSADSLGYLFLSKTKYDPSSFVSTLGELKEIDKPAFNEPLEFTQFFKCSASIFDFKSLKPYFQSSAFTAQKQKDEYIDSLRTHPACDKRIEYIRELVKKNPSSKGLKSNEVLFKKVAWASSMETIMGYFKHEYYDLALFNALLFAQKYKNDEFINSMINLSWFKIYEAMKNHQLSDYLSNYSEGNPEQFNNLLFLLNNLRLSEMIDFGNCSYEKSMAVVKTNELALALNYCKSKMNDDGQSLSWKEKYQAKYDKGQFGKLLELKSFSEGKKKK